jgi:type IV pilus assembly protein PilA
MHARQVVLRVNSHEKGERFFMLNRLQQRLASEEGFTLIELLVVIVIIGILLAIAVPSYLGFKDRANKSAAQSNVRAAVPAAEAYFADYNTYADVASPPAGLPNGNFDDITFMKTNYDSGMKVEGLLGDTDKYCITAVSGDYRAKIKGPGGTVAVDKTSTLGVCAAADIA